MSKLAKLLSLGASLIPGAGPLVKAVGIINSFRGSDDQLPPDAPGADVQAAYAALTPEQRAVADRRGEIELAEITAEKDKLEAMVSAETASANTRPHIAMVFAYVIAFAVVGLISALLLAVYKGDPAMLSAVADAWPLALSLLGVPAGVVNSYFGKRTREKQARYAASQGQDVAAGGIVGAIAGLLKR